MSSPLCMLTINLDAISANWCALNAISGSAQCAAVVKADAYGLGVERVAPVLYRSGCRHFFVASVYEAVCLRPLLNDDAHIYSLSGFFPGEEHDCIRSRIIPVLVSYDMFRHWLAVASASKTTAVIKIDTGMSRLGFSHVECEALLNDLKASPYLLREAKVSILMSHLACADEPAHPLNDRQISAFHRVLRAFREYEPRLTASISNSFGVLLGESCQFDMVRLGIALYGGLNTLPSDVFVSRRVVTLRLPIIQLRDVRDGEAIGYGATSSAPHARHCAIIAGGYADGIFRSLSNSGIAYVDGYKAPFVGRVSMDSFVIDMTKIPSDVRKRLHQSGVHYVELLGEHQSIDELAASAGTISYEILTSLSRRFRRIYIENAS